MLITMIKTYATDESDAKALADDQNYILNNIPTATLFDKTINAYFIKRRCIFDKEKYPDEYKHLKDLGFIEVA